MSFNCAHEPSKINLSLYPSTIQKKFPSHSQNHRTQYTHATIKKLAVITGGACRLGLEVAKSLAGRRDWESYLLDLNISAGEAEASRLSATFHHANVTLYESLASTFKAIFQADGRFNFVFANVGIAENTNFYTIHDTGIEPPPE